MDIILLMFLAIAGTYVLTMFFKFLGLPRVLAPIFVGVLMGLPGIKSAFFDPLSLSFFNDLSDIGLIFLLFYVGLGVDFKQMKHNSRQLIFVSVVAVVVPFIFGFVMMLLLGYSFLVAFIIGAAFSVSAEGIVVALLKDEKLLNTKVGRIIVGAGIIDDVFEILVITSISVFVISKNAHGHPFFDVFVNLALFVLFLIGMRLILIPVINQFLDKSENENRPELFTATMILVLFIAVITDYLQLGFAIGALIAGVALRYVYETRDVHKRHHQKKIQTMVELVAFGFFSIFFFLWIGINVDLSSLLDNIHLGLIFAFLAIFGKWLGGAIGYFFGGTATFPEANLVGWGINARGAVELIIAEIARQDGLISSGIFSALVFMTVVSTFLVPIMFSFFVRYYKKKRVL